MLILARNKITKKISYVKFFVYFFIITILLLSFLNYYESKILSFIKKDIVIRSKIKEFGIGGINRDTNKKDILYSFVKNLPYNILPISTFDTMYLDINFQNFEKLKIDKKRSLKKKYINSEEVSWVKGRIKFKNKSLMSNIRIKGDLLDHVATKKISLRVNIINDGIYNMKKFSLQSPKTRDFHYEEIFNKLLSLIGLKSPKSFYVKLIVNGDSWGNMYLQEHPSESYTNNLSKPYGPLYKLSYLFSFYNDDLFWSNNENLLYSTPKLLDLYSQPEKNYLLLDEISWAKYISVSFLLKCWHGNTDKNLRFYFNPINKKFEPISFNNSCGQTYKNQNSKFLPNVNEFIFRLIKIQSFRKILIQEIEEWLNNPNYISHLKEIQIYEKDLRKKLSIDAKFLEPINVSTEHLKNVLKWLRDNDNFNYESSNNYSFDRDNFNLTEELKKINGLSSNKNKFLPYINYKNRNYKLIIFNYNKKLYDIKYILLNLKNKKKQKIKFKNLNFLESDNFLSIDLNNLTNENLNQILDIKLVYIDKENPNFEIITRDLNLHIDYSSTFFSKTQSEQNSIKLDNNNIKYIKEIFFVDESKKIIQAKENQNIYINKSIILPPNYEFIVDKGVNLIFSPDASLIANNKIKIIGDHKKPVKFSGINNNSWPGFLILANNKKVLIDSLIVENATGKNIFGFNYTGGFTLHRAKNFIMKNVTFINSSGEDALNIIESNGLVKNLLVKNTKSDALDLDFSIVDIDDSSFINIGSSTGADAIDTSGSKVKIKNIEIQNVKDKAISIGEGSIINIKNVKINNALVGMAVKDSSKVEGNDIKFSNTKLANVMTFIKKDYFDGSTVNLSNVEFKNNLFVNQKKSSLIINEKVISSSNLDVKQLYKTVMKSNKN